MNLQSIKFKNSIIRKELTKYKADAYILVNDINREWYTGVWVDYGFVLITKTKAFSFADPRDFTKSVKHVKHAQNIQVTDLNIWINFVKKLNLKHVLIEGDYLTLTQKKQFIDPLNIKKMTEVRSADLRAQKTDEEIAIMQKSADIVVDCENHLRKWIKVGMTEKQVETEVYRYFGARGASGASFGPMTIFGKNAGDPHAQVGNNKLKSGDCILIDIGCIYEGYCSDITRTYTIGKPSAEMQKMIDVTKAAQALAVSKIKAGMTGQQIDSIAREYIKKHYHGYNIPHGVGHGLGRQFHEFPMNNQSNTQPLPVNAVVTIEPGIYNEYGGVRIEDSVVVKKNGCVVLTKKAI